MREPERHVPPEKVALEDYLALAPSEEDRMMLLAIWIQVGVERMAEELGLAATLRSLDNLTSYVRNARALQLGRRWKP